MSERIFNNRFDRFYLYAGISLIPLAILAIFVLRGIFDALSVARQVDEELLNVAAPRIEQARLDEAYSAATEREFVPLDLRE